jgi:RNA polymerase-binding transcription factor DksA
MAKKVKKAAKKTSSKGSSRTKPAKKAAKKPAKKKAAAKKPAKKAARKPVAKKKAPAKKAAKKPAPKPAKKIVARTPNKPAPAKVSAKSVKQEKKQAEPKKVAEAPKPEVSASSGKKNVPVTTAPVAKAQPKKKDEDDMDDDNTSKKSLKSKSNEEFFEEFSYKPNIRKANANQPKPHIGADNRTRYSDDELQEFKELILEKLAEAQKDYELLKSTLSHKDDHGTDDTSPTFKLLEDGSDVLSKEETAQLAARQEKFIQNLKNALIRIENKTYGICRATGRLISKERLRSVPHATLDIDAKLEQSY